LKVQPFKAVFFYALAATVALHHVPEQARMVEIADSHESPDGGFRSDVMSAPASGRSSKCSEYLNLN
jgi:hypothetical protein